MALVQLVPLTVVSINNRNLTSSKVVYFNVHRIPSFQTNLNPSNAMSLETPYNYILGTTTFMYTDGFNSENSIKYGVNESTSTIAALVNQ